MVWDEAMGVMRFVGIANVMRASMKYVCIPVDGLCHLTSEDGSSEAFFGEVRGRIRAHSWGPPDCRGRPTYSEELLSLSEYLEDLHGICRRMTSLLHSAFNQEAYLTILKVR